MAAKLSSRLVNRLKLKVPKRPREVGKLRREGEILLVVRHGDTTKVQSSKRVREGSKGCSVDGVMKFETHEAFQRKV